MLLRRVPNFGTTKLQKQDSSTTQTLQENDFIVFNYLIIYQDIRFLLIEPLESN